MNFAIFELILRSLSVYMEIRATLTDFDEILGMYTTYFNLQTVFFLIFITDSQKKFKKRPLLFFSLFRARAFLFKTAKLVT